MKKKDINNDMDLQTYFQTFQNTTLGLLDHTLHLIAVKILIPWCRREQLSTSEGVSNPRTGEWLSARTVIRVVPIKLEARL